MDNLILMTDSYKVSHWKQYPKGTEYVYSYFESRGGQYPKSLFFGLQYYIKKYLVGAAVNHKKVVDARLLYRDHFGNDKLFNEEGWAHIILTHDGKLPIEIKSVLEGSLVNISTPLFTVENTCPECFWLTNYLETLLDKVWYPTTITTKSLNLKNDIKFYLNKTGDDIPDFKLHDFGYRGSTSEESAGIGGAAHLINFQGTDTIAAIRLLQQYYGAGMPAFSIPAAEHSTITSWGRENEVKAFENMLDQFSTGLVAVVSDSYDIFSACENLWGNKLKDKIINRNGTLIIRPDSGDPVKVIPQVLDILGEKFGFTNNLKGYKVLPTYLRVIQGDGIDEKTLLVILTTIAARGWSIDNIAFGSGGGLLQNVTRDTMKFAYKCSNITIDGKDQGVSKNPITDPGKASKMGRFEGLVPVFKNGELLLDQLLTDIRKRSNEG